MGDLFAGVEQAYREAVSDGTYRSITVKDLCAQAHVSRKAFYKQFGGRSDILRQVFDRDIARPVIELCQLLSFERMCKLAPEMQSHQFEAVYKDRKFYHDVVCAPEGGREAFMRAASTSFRELNLFMLEQFGYAGEPWQVEAIANYFAFAKAGYLAEWIKADFEAPVDEVSKLYCAMAMPFWNSLRT